MMRIGGCFLGRSSMLSLTGSGKLLFTEGSVYVRCFFLDELCLATSAASMGGGSHDNRFHECF